LQVPNDLKILGVAFDPARLCCIVHLEGERLPECEQGAYPQPINTTCYQENGKVRVEWHYPLPKGKVDVNI